MKTIISALHFEWRDIDHCLERVRNDFDLDGVELSWHESFAHPHCSRTDIETLKKIGPRESLDLCAHIWEDLARMGEAAEDSLLQWLGLCEKTGVSGLVIHGGSYGDRKEGIARTRRILEKVLGRFEKAGVILNLENHYAYDYQQCHELFSEPWEFEEVFSLESPSLKFCFDTGHAHMTRNWESLLRRLSASLNHIHLADNHGSEDDHCPYRYGTVPWDPMFDLIGELGFGGTFCVEFPVREDHQPFHQCMDELRNRWG